MPPMAMPWWATNGVRVGVHYARACAPPGGVFALFLRHPGYNLL